MLYVATVRCRLQQGLHCLYRCCDGVRSVHQRSQRWSCTANVMTIPAYADVSALNKSQSYRRVCCLLVRFRTLEIVLVQASPERSSSY